MDLQKFIPTLGRASYLQTFAARLPHAQPGSLGDWSAQAVNAANWQAMATGAALHGSITMAADGLLQFDLDDYQGWHPFVALAGEGAGRQFQVNCRYAWDGTFVEDSELATYDATFDRFIRLGTASNGTLAGNGHRSRILVAALDGQPWTINDAWVGWVQSA